MGGYWTFDGPTINWTTNVVSELANTMGATGTLQNMSKNSAATGKIGQALNFRRSSLQNINLASSTLFDFVPPFSFSVWVNPADIPSGNGTDCPHYYPVISSDLVGWGWNLTLGETFNGAYNRFEINRYSEQVQNWDGVDSNATFVANKLYHIAGSFYPTKTELYINGVLDNSADATEVRIYYPNNGVSIGGEACGATSEYFNGKIDDVRIYNRALSAAEVKQLYNAGR